MKDKPPNPIGTEEPCHENENKVNIEQRTTPDRRRQPRINPSAAPWPHGTWISMFDDVKAEEK